MKASALGSSALFLFIAPPSIEELERRLRGRGTEAEAEIRVRVCNAASEIEASREPSFFHHVIVNNVFEQAYADVLAAISNHVPGGIPPSAIASANLAASAATRAAAAVAANVHPVHHPAADTDTISKATTNPATSAPDVASSTNVHPADLPATAGTDTVSNATTDPATSALANDAAAVAAIVHHAHLSAAGTNPVSNATPATSTLANVNASANPAADATASDAPTLGNVPLTVPSTTSVTEAPTAGAEANTEPCELREPGESKGLAGSETVVYPSLGDVFAGSSSAEEAVSDHPRTPAREYMDSTVVPALRDALRALNRVRPHDPLLFLSDFFAQARLVAQ